MSAREQELEAELRRLLAVADDLIRGTEDPGTEALGAAYCARRALDRVPPEPQPIEDSITEYMARLEADRQAEHHVLVVEAAGLAHHVGPFATVEAAFAWNEERRNGADAKVLPVQAPWRPWREPKR